MKTRKVVDWIRMKNFKEHSRNMSALVGLKRVNKILGTSAKLMFTGFLLYIPFKLFTKDVEEVLKNGANEFNRKLDITPNKEKIFQTCHYRSIINFIDEIVIFNKIRK